MGVRDILAARAYVEFDSNASAMFSDIKRLSAEFNKVKDSLNLAKGDRNVLRNRLGASKDSEKILEAKILNDKAKIRAKMEDLALRQKREYTRITVEEKRSIKESVVQMKKLADVRARIAKMQRDRRNGIFGPSYKRELSAGFMAEKQLLQSLRKRQISLRAMKAEKKRLVEYTVKQYKALARTNIPARDQLKIQRKLTAKIREKLALNKKVTSSLISQARGLQMQLKDTSSAALSMINPLGKIRRGFNRITKSVYQNRLAILATGTALAFLAQRAVKMFKVVDDNLLAVKGISRATGEEFRALTKTVLNLGRTTSFTAGQVAEAAKQLSKAGFSAAQIQASLAPALDLSRATGASLEDTSAIVARTLSQFNLSASDTTRVVDVLGTAVNSGVLTLEDMAESMKFLGPVGDSLGFTLEEVASSFTVLANNGLRGGVAARQLKRAFTELSKDDKIDLLREKLGVEAFENGKAKPLNQIVEELGMALQSLNPQQQLNLLDKLFGEGTPAMAALTRNTEDFMGVLAEVENSRGNIEKLAKTMDAGVGGAIRLLLSAMESLSVNLSKLFEDQLVYGITLIKSIVSRVSEWIDGNNELRETVMNLLSSGISLIKWVSTAIAAFVTFKGILMAGSTAFGVAKVAIDGLRAAHALYTIQASAAAVASTALNASTGGMAAAIGKLAAAVLTLVAGFIGYNTVASSLADVQDQITAATADAARAVENLNKVNNENSEKPYTKLVKQLRELEFQYEKTGVMSEKSFVKTAKTVKQLESALGVGLGVTVDETTGRILGLPRAFRAIDEAIRKLEIGTELDAAKAKVIELENETEKLRNDSIATDDGDITLKYLAAEKALKLARIEAKELQKEFDRLDGVERKLYQDRAAKIKSDIDKLLKEKSETNLLSPEGAAKADEIDGKVRKLRDKLFEVEIELDKIGTTFADLEKSDFLPDPEDFGYGNLSKDAKDLANNLEPLKLRAEFGFETQSEVDKLFASVSGAFDKALKNSADLAEQGEDEIKNAWFAAMEEFSRAAKDAALTDEGLADAFKEGSLRAKMIMEEQVKALADARNEAIKKLDSDASKLVSQVSSALLKSREGALGGKDLGFRQSKKVINLDELILKEEKVSNKLLEEIKEVLRNQRGLVGGVG